jgi:hypothetical protein
MPGSCSTGFRSPPSGGIGNRRPNGSEVNRMKARNPTEMMPSTPMTRAANASGNCLLKKARASVQTLRMKIHSSIDPSCAPHTAVTR